MGSFTPVNQSPVAMAAANDGTRNRSRGLDSDLYDLPNEPLPPGSPALKTRKMSREKTMRRKSAFSSPLTHPWKNGTEKESSQLSTPPHSKERASTRSSTQTMLFPDAAVSKPIQSLMELTTTEGARNVSVGQTTMDKLASFRYQRLPQLNSVAGRQENTDLPGVIANGPSFTDLSSNHPASHSISESNIVCDEASVVDHDDILFMADEGEQRMSQQGLTLKAQLDSEDDFPLDDDLEAEMAWLSVPERLIDEHLSENLQVQSLHYGGLQDEGLQSNNTCRGYFQLSRLSSHTLAGDNNAAKNLQTDRSSAADSVICLGAVPRPLDQPIDWPPPTGIAYPSSAVNPPENTTQTFPFIDNTEYSPLQPFARPGFPSKVCDRSPITGVSSNIILRTCFRIGEALREAAICDRLGQDAIIELFARVTSSSKCVNISKLQFQFADLFHDRPPFVRGELENYQISALQETESKVLLDLNGSPPMVRCLGRLKRAIAGPPGWMLHIINIRATDWEEVRWTKRIAGAGMMK
jgi:hypothetical protein